MFIVGRRGSRSSGGRAAGGRSERERGLVESHMPGGEDASGVEVVAAVAVVVGGVPDKDARHRTWTQFVGRRRRGVWVAQRSEDA